MHLSNPKKNQQRGAGCPGFLMWKFPVHHWKVQDALIVPEQSSSGKSSKQNEDAFDSPIVVWYKRLMEEFGTKPQRKQQHFPCSKNIMATPVIDSQLEMRVKKRVRFGKVTVRSYNVVVGDHPCCSAGAPIALGWDYYEKKYIVGALEDEPSSDDDTASLSTSSSSNSTNQHSGQRRQSRPRSVCILSAAKRHRLLRHWGFSTREMYHANEQVQKVQKQRKTTLALLPLHDMQELLRKKTTLKPMVLRTLVRVTASGNNKMDASDTLLALTSAPTTSHTKRRPKKRSSGPRGPMSFGIGSMKGSGSSIKYLK